LLLPVAQWHFHFVAFISISRSCFPSLPSPSELFNDLGENTQSSERVQLPVVGKKTQHVAVMTFDVVIDWELSVRALSTGSSVCSPATALSVPTHAGRSRRMNEFHTARSVSGHPLRQTHELST
jgi:hypothetical protein